MKWKVQGVQQLNELMRYEKIYSFHICENKGVDLDQLRCSAFVLYLSLVTESIIF